jgi:cytochrome P450
MAYEDIRASVGVWAGGSTGNLRNWVRMDQVPPPPGSGGPHFCLGANLARREMTVMFDTIRTRIPSLRITGEPDYLQSAFINGIKRLQCA